MLRLRSPRASASFRSAGEKRGRVRHIANFHYRDLYPFLYLSLDEFIQETIRSLHPRQRSRLLALDQFIRRRKLSLDEAKRNEAWISREGTKKRRRGRDSRYRGPLPPLPSLETSRS